MQFLARCALLASNGGRTAQIPKDKLSPHDAAAPGSRKAADRTLVKRFHFDARTGTIAPSAQTSFNLSGCGRFCYKSPMRLAFCHRDAPSWGRARLSATSDARYLLVALRRCYRLITSFAIWPLSSICPGHSAGFCESAVARARHSAAARMAGRRSSARSHSTGSWASVTSFSISTPQPMQKN